MDSIEFGFDTLAALTGGAIIHRGIYEDPEREKLVAYTIVGGLKSPKKRIEELKISFERLADIMDRKNESESSKNLVIMPKLKGEVVYKNVNFSFSE